ncbi:MAG: Uma2 family endonuclease [Methylococcales bacterium]|jgi:Uma2 family endonuclease|nr:Uma2 family endonuclease [Methylococcales bacterium]
MNVKHASTYISVLDYLGGEKISDVKHEYINGEVYAMAGASRSHNILTGNVWSAFMAHLDGTRCISFSSDMKVNIDNQFFYPDVLVTCDDDLGDDYYTKAPIILVEVLSKSTRKMDKSFKLAAYKTIPSLLEYVLIEQEFAEIEICRRHSHWSSTHYFLGDDVHFESIDLTLSVEAIYRRVQNQDVIDYLQAQT